MALRILVAEDEALVALSLSDMLEAEGHDVELAFDGAAALTAARCLGALLDVLVTDLNMPYLSGEALIHDLRTERPGLPVVVVTGSPPPGGAEELRRSSGGYGPLILLHKPIDYLALLDAMQAATHKAARGR
jgi:CheY-like chemotaxis protein